MTMTTQTGFITLASDQRTVQSEGQSGPGFLHSDSETLSGRRNSGESVEPSNSEASEQKPDELWRNWQAPK